MTALTDLLAITPTTNAKAAAQAAGTHLPTLLSLAQGHVVELRSLLKQIVALHPSGDANLSALNALLAELA